MKILAHRGYWTTEAEKNTLPSFKRAFEHGYGIETDVRDYHGNLVISHNIADETCPLFETVLKLYQKTCCSGFLAINIKADGLQEKLKLLLEKYDVKNYFVFDMSIPELVVYRAKKINYFTRLSEYETEPVLVEDAMGIWMDEWENSWINREVIYKYLKQGKLVSIISPEIHKRNSKKIWDEVSAIESAGLMLCVDAIDKFIEYMEG